MNKVSKSLNLLIYVVILALVVFLLLNLFGSSNAVTVSYSEVRTLFLEEKVKSFDYDDGILTLSLSEPFMESTTVGRRYVPRGAAYGL